jgi:hypothetical protein
MFRRTFWRCIGRSLQWILKCTRYKKDMSLMQLKLQDSMVVKIMTWRCIHQAVHRMDVEVDSGEEATQGIPLLGNHLSIQKWANQSMEAYLMAVQEIDQEVSEIATVLQKCIPLQFYRSPMTTSTTSHLLYRCRTS